MAGEISRSEELRWHNCSRILTLLRRSGQMSRTDAASASGMSHSTVSAIVSTLLEDRALLEVAETNPGNISKLRGRPQVLLALNPDFASIIAVDVSLNLIAVEHIDYAGHSMARVAHRVATLRISRDELLTQLCAHIDALITADGAPASPVQHISVSVQGMTDAAQEELIWSPTIGAKNVPIAKVLEAHFQVPVIVSNDCLMIAESLRWSEPEVFGDDFAAILFSSGIGMGLYLKGKPFSGARSSAAEFGHVVHNPEGALCRCGRRGCLEAYASDYGIWRVAHHLDENAPPVAMINAADFEALAEKARAVAGIERDAFQQAGKALGYALRSMFALIDPIPIAFVGPGVHAFDLIEDNLRTVTSGGPETGAATGPYSGLNSPEDLSFHCYPDEHPLILQGCAVTSLKQVDRLLNQHRNSVLTLSRKTRKNSA